MALFGRVFVLNGELASGAAVDVSRCSFDEVVVVVASMVDSHIVVNVMCLLLESLRRLILPRFLSVSGKLILFSF